MRSRQPHEQRHRAHLASKLRERTWPRPFKRQAPSVGARPPWGRDAPTSLPLRTAGGGSVCLLFYMFPLGKHASRKLAQHRLILWAGSFQVPNRHPTYMDGKFGAGSQREPAEAGPAATGRIRREGWHSGEARRPAGRLRIRGEAGDLGTACGSSCPWPDPWLL